MHNKELVRRLEDLAEALTPLSELKPAVYGSRLADWKHDWSEPDPYALAWWSTLKAIAAMIEYQVAPLTKEQITFIKSRLFGGMGSLRDLWFDSRALGPDAETVNKRLAEELTAFHQAIDANKED